MKIINKILSLPIILTISILFLAACQPTPRAETFGDDILQVTVSVPPQAYFVERIGGSQVSVNVMVGPGEEAHTYEPTPEQMKTLNNTSVFFTIGVEYEETWIPRFEDINPQMRVVDSAAGIQRIPMTGDQSHDGDDSDHAGDGRLDPHVWLAPDNGKTIAGNILTTLVELAPEHEATFQANYDALVADIDTLEAQIQSIFLGLEQRSFMVFHPAWGYFAEQFNLRQIPVQVGGQDPSVRELTDLVKIARKENIQVIFVQPTFSAVDAEAIAQEIGGEVAVVNPLARDWLANLQTVAETFAAALSE